MSSLKMAKMEINPNYLEKNKNIVKSYEEP